MHLAAIISLLSAASLTKAAVVKRTNYPATCDNAQTLFTTSGQMSQVQSFCTAYLGIVAKTITVTSTTVVGTLTGTGTTYTTTTSTFTPALSVTTTQSTTTGSVTTTPGAVTTTATITSTAYLDNDGNTITVMRRSLPTDLAKRGAVTPAVMSGWARPSVSSACECLNIQPSTITRTSQALGTATASVILSRTILRTTSIATPKTTTTTVQSNTQTLVAPAPLQTSTTTDMEQVDGCPPDTTSTFLCPEGTGNDDGSQTANEQINCSVDANDGYSGACDYWNDDGAPAGSVLYMYDPNHPGDPAYQWSRNATYGDSPNDDCPTWSDWTCADNGDGRVRRAINLIERDVAAVKKKTTSHHTHKKTTSHRPTSTSHSHYSKPTKSSSKSSSSSSSSSDDGTGSASTTTVMASQPTETGNGLHPFSSLFGLKNKPLRGGNYVDWSVAQSKMDQ